MARIDVPAGEGGDAVQLWTLRPEMAPAIGKFVESVYHKSQLPTRERELARMRIAQINDCVACATFRAGSVKEEAIDEELYASVENFRADSRYTEREKLAIEYAERFALDHASLDDEFFVRLRSHFADAEILDLGICVSMFLGLGRLLSVLGIEEADPNYVL